VKLPEIELASEFNTRLVGCDAGLEQDDGRLQVKVNPKLGETVELSVQLAVFVVPAVVEDQEVVVDRVLKSVTAAPVIPILGEMLVVECMYVVL
jgi:hypothetical protein